MNGPEWAITIVGGVVTVLLLWKLLLAERNVSRLSREFVIFAEVSTQMGSAVTQLLNGQLPNGRVTPIEQPLASRRDLIAQAHQALNDGEPIEALAKRLGLCHDEISLITRC